MFIWLQVLRKSQVIVEGAVQQCRDEATIQVRHFTHSYLGSMVLEVVGPGE